MAPQAAAPGGALYTQTQVWPSDLVFSYPYRVTGKLFARDGTSGQGLTCTASAIAPRLVITAAHCLYDNQTGAWATDFLFVPAYHLGLAPYGAWTATSAFITPEWAAQTVLPHPADVGLLVMADQSLDGPLLRIGDVTGWYGYVLSDLISHRFHVDFLGYPGNLDQGEIMQRTGAQTAFTFPPNNASYGSDQQQGSSGGPYVIDLQTPALGSIGRFPAVVGVESTGDGQGKVDISLLDSSFLNILNAACLGAFGNC